MSKLSENFAEGTGGLSGAFAEGAGGLSEAFAEGKAFIPFVTVGDPDIETTAAIVRELDAAGARIIELGIPFSDPTAEGPVIQDANIRALAGGVTTDDVFALATNLTSGTDIVGSEATPLGQTCQGRKRPLWDRHCGVGSDPSMSVPIGSRLVVMTYANVVFHYGVERFCERAAAAGISGLILADVPFEEKAEFADICRAHGIDFISMIAPTSEDRIAMIAREAEGFIYLVSSLGVTGVRTDITTDLDAIVAKIREVSDVPIAIGFGISNAEQAAKMSQIADGVIVGSAIVRLIGEHGTSAPPVVGDFAREIVGAIQ